MKINRFVMTIKLIVNYKLFITMGIFLLITACSSENLWGISPSPCFSEEVAVLDDHWRVSASLKIPGEYVIELQRAPETILALSHGIRNSDQMFLRAYDAEKGNEVWHVSVDELGVPTNLPNYKTTDNYTVIQTMKALYVLQSNTGEIKLQVPNSWIFSLAIDHDHLYLHDFFGTFQAYSISSGELIWERNIPEAGKASNMFVANGDLIISLLTGLWILDAEDGSLIKNISSYKSSSDEALYDDSILIGQEGIGHAFLQAVSVQDGLTLWEKRYYPFMIYEPPVISNNVLYFPARNLEENVVTEIVAVDMDSGNLEWKKTFDTSRVISGINILNEIGYAIFSDGTLRAINLRTGETTLVLQSEGINYWETDTSSFFSTPNLVIYNQDIFVSFGCTTVYKLQKIWGQ